MDKQVKKGIILLLIAMISIAACWKYYQGRKSAPGNDGNANISISYEASTLHAGHGDTAVKPGDLLAVNYVGFYEDGSIFSSSLANDVPYEVYIDKGEAFKGWDEGLIGMVEGEKRKLVVPPDYAGSGAEADAREGAVLYYEVELLEIK